MPRGKSTDEKETKRAPRKRVASVRATSTTRAARSTRATASGSERKAPTRTITTSVSTIRPSRNKGLVVALVAFAVVVGTAAFVGFSDKGQIDVNSRITAVNQEIVENNNNNPEEQRMVIPVQNNTPTVPNAGLRGRGVGTPPVGELNQATPIEETAPPVDDSTSTTTTEAQTEELVDEEVKAETLVN